MTSTRNDRGHIPNTCFGRRLPPCKPRQPPASSACSPLARDAAGPKLAPRERGVEAGRWRGGVRVRGADNPGARLKPRPHRHCCVFSSPQRLGFLKMKEQVCPRSRPCFSGTLGFFQLWLHSSSACQALRAAGGGGRGVHLRDP